jgi:uncharacterized protein (TIGR02646 family)
MIRIVRPVRVPDILRRRGNPTTQANNAAFDARPEAYRTGAEKFAFDRTIYGAKSVKKALIKAQRKKCAFCEAKILNVDHGDVEHFRPKGGVQDAANAPMLPLGYYWLAYEWDNLFFACAMCNQTGKKNLFPLANPANRARSHHDDHTAEVSLLIEPAQDDPEEHIGFRQEVAFPIEGGERGQATIDILNLNRQELVERRLDRLGLLEALRDLLRLFPADNPQTAAARQRLEDATEPTAEYASMARWLLHRQH